MTGFDDVKQRIRRNKLLGMWAAKKLGITGPDAKAYSHALVVGALDPDHSDVFSKIRKDFDDAGVVQSDEQILSAMKELMLQAGKHAALNLLLDHCRDRLTLVDVGARWGAHDRWLPLDKVADIVCFEPDIEECRRLETSRRPNVRYLPIGLSDTDGQRDLFVTLEPACNSNFEPIPALHEHYPGLAMIRPVQKTTMFCKRLDDVLMDQGIGPVAAIKLDTQGSELSIMRGGERVLAGCSLVDIEVEFNPIYQRQALFCDVDRFLRDRGFVLWRFDDLAHYSTEVLTSAQTTMRIAADPGASTMAEVSNGQVYWAQAQYVRAEYPRTGAEHMELSEAIVPAILTGAYGWWDIALELIRKTGESGLLNRLRGNLAR
jgi:FkbM family methyltransferase